jgi:methyl-accepting chemotaxis protein
MNFKDFSFKNKILTLLAIPLAGFIWGSASTIAQSVSTNHEMAQLTQLTKLSTVYSELVHELQKERGMTAGFLGSKGEKFGNKLQKQRQETNNKNKRRLDYWQKHNFTHPKVSLLNSEINQRLQKLSSMRSSIDQLKTSLPEALGYYTQLNAQLLNISTIISTISTDAAITQEIASYYNFIQGKERAGIERAVLSNTFSKDSFANGMLVKFITLMSEQNTYFSNFKAFSPQASKHFFEQQMSHNAIGEVKKLRAIALAKSSTGQFNVEAEYWFEQSTKRIGQIKKIENQLSATLINLVQTKESDAFNSMILNIILTSIFVSIAIILSLYVIKDLTSRVTNLTSVMSKVRDNNDLTVRAKFEGVSEMGQIASALNLTLEKFSGAIDEISSSSSTLAAASEQTSLTCGHNSKSMFEQQDEIGVIATAIEELSATVKEVAGNTQLAADSAKEADTQAQNGLEVVQKSYHSIEDLAEGISNLAAKITSLHESSNNITNVVDVIKSVAEQTNLLALNAAIEAARAGEQGRGFAVVADEVRTLAQRTQESTSEIESFITSLQSDANSAFNVIEASQKMATTAVENSKDVEQTLSDITNSVSNIFSMTEQVATAVEEQAVVTQDVARNVVNIEQKSMESTTAATQIANTAKEQANLSTTLQDIAIAFKI